MPASPEIKDFSDLTTRKQALFSLMGLTEKSNRVRQWLEKKNKPNLDALTFREYEGFVKAVEKAWITEHSETLLLRRKINHLFSQLELTWNDAPIKAFLNSDQVVNDGLTPTHLKRLCEALQKEIDGDSK